MSTDEMSERVIVLDETHEFAEPPEQVWRALTRPELRERWLPGGALAYPEPVSSVAERNVSYRLREREPPFLESTVTFRLEPSETGGTCVRIVHELTDARLRRSEVQHTNGYMAPLMRAA